MKDTAFAHRANSGVLKWKRLMLRKVSDNVGQKHYYTEIIMPKHDEYELEPILELQSLSTHEAINLFLENFDYLNDDGERNTSCLFFWKRISNTQLTSEIVGRAKNFKAELADLSLESGAKPFIETLDNFVSIVKSVFHDVQVMRFRYGDVKVTTTPMLFQPGPIYGQMEWQPISPGYFRKALVKGLSKLGNALETDLQQELKELSRDLQKYKAKGVFMREVTSLVESPMVVDLSSQNKREAYALANNIGMN